jgi:multisubunit Na+/H+ antiporter MnhE subunit
MHGETVKFSRVKVYKFLRYIWYFGTIIIVSNTSVINYILDNTNKI